MRITLALIVAGVLTLHATGAQEAQVVVLKARSSQPSADGKHKLVTLESGATIAIPASDIDDNLTAAVRQATAREPKPAAPSFTSEPPLDTSIIRPKCAKEWPDDFSVRAYCEKTQNEAVQTLRARSMTTPDQRIIRTKCAKEWPDDFSVRTYCEKTQLEALQRIGR